MSDEKVIIVGFNGFGREILWTARRAQAQSPGWTAEILGYTEKEAKNDHAELDGLPFLGLEGPELLTLKPVAPTHFICGVGDNKTRKTICLKLEALGLKPMTVIDPSVIIGPGVTVGPGSYIGAGTILSPLASIGRHVVVNQCCTIGHDSIVENFAQVCPGARISGWVKVGEGTLLGSNSVAAPRVTLGSWAVLAASSFASQNLLDGVTALGIPAKPLFKNTGSKPNKENA